MDREELAMKNNKSSFTNKLTLVDYAINMIEDEHIILHGKNGMISIGLMCMPGEEYTDVIHAGNSSVHVEN